MDLYIIRHARPLRHVVAAGDGTADPDLSETGRLQAERTADFLASEGIDHVVSSTMRRAHQTALPLAGRLGLDIELIDGLKESDHRSQAYVPVEEMSPDDPDSAHYFDGDNLFASVFIDGYEPFEKRVVASFEHVIAANRSRRVAVFCHGMVTTVYLKTILGIHDVFSLLIDYCGINRVQASSKGHRTVRSVNETAHVRDLIEW